MDIYLIEMRICSSHSKPAASEDDAHHKLLIFYGYLSAKDIHGPNNNRMLFKVLEREVEQCNWRRK